MASRNSYAEWPPVAGRTQKGHNMFLLLLLVLSCSTLSDITQDTCSIDSRHNKDTEREITFFCPETKVLMIDTFHTLTVILTLTGYGALMTPNM